MTMEEEERDGKFNLRGNSKDILLSFLDYARSFQEVEDLRKYLSSRKPASPVASEGESGPRKPGSRSGRAGLMVMRPSF